MRLPLSRVGIALATASISLLPFASAHAQYSGTNGQIYFDYMTTAFGSKSIAAVNPDGTESHIVIPAPATGFLGSYAFSPDGTKIVYQSNDGTTTTLKIINSDGSGTPSTLYTPTGTQSPSNPVFSTDGTKVYFYLGNDPTITNNGIFSIPAAGGSLTSISPDSSGIQHSIVIASSAKLFEEVSTYSPLVGSHRIDASNLDGTSSTIIFTTSGTFMDIDDISPDGTKLLINERINSLGVISTIDVPAGTGHAVIISNSTDNIDYANFSPDVTKIVYAQSHRDVTTNATSYIGTYIVAANGTGTPASVRQDALYPHWSRITLAIAGTYPTPLVLGITSQNFQGGGGTGAPAPVLPAAARSTSRIPVALTIISIVTVAGIEITRRVRARRQS